MSEPPTRRNKLSRPPGKFLAAPLGSRNLRVFLQAPLSTQAYFGWPAVFPLRPYVTKLAQHFDIDSTVFVRMSKQVFFS